MSQRSNVAKNIIKKAISARREAMPGIKQQLESITKRLRLTPNDEKLQEMEASITCRRENYLGEIEELETMLESNSIRLIEKSNLRATVAIDDKRYVFNNVPRTYYSIK